MHLFTIYTKSHDVFVGRPIENGVIVETRWVLLRVKMNAVVAVEVVVPVKLLFTLPARWFFCSIWLAWPPLCHGHTTPSLQVS